jgi:hypothetical protein
MCPVLCTGAGEGAADSLAGGLTGPSSRRREQYDDEDQWEELVLAQKTTQQQKQQGAHQGERPVHSCM